MYTEGAVSDVYRKDGQGLIQRRLGVGCVEGFRYGTYTGRTVRDLYRENGQGCLQEDGQGLIQRDAVSDL